MKTKTAFDVFATVAWGEPGVTLIVNADEAGGGYFVGQLRQRLAATEPKSQLLLLPSASAGMAMVYEQLYQTFLGTQIHYWLVPSVPWQTKLKKELFDVLGKYVGPHAVTIVLSPEDADYFIGNKRMRRVELPKLVAGSQLEALAAFLGYERAARILPSVAGLFHELSLDQACLLVRHAHYLPVKEETGIQRYLVHLVPEASSLGVVSDLFLRREWPAFFTQWNRLVAEYSDMFWVAFFSDLVWRAYYVQRALVAKDLVQAKRMSFRLPASFITKTWRLSTGQELADLYEQLYFFDTRVKKGSAFSMQDFLISSSFVAGRQE